MPQPLQPLVTDLKENVDSILNLTRDIGSFISEGSELRNLLQLVVQAVVQDTAADTSIIFRFNKDGKAVIDVENGITPTEDETRILLEYLSSRIFRPNSVIKYQNEDELPEKLSGLDELKDIMSLLAVPLIVEGRVFGVIAALKIKSGSQFQISGSQDYRLSQNMRPCRSTTF